MEINCSLMIYVIIDEINGARLWSKTEYLAMFIQVTVLINKQILSDENTECNKVKLGLTFT